ncbi:MAG: TIGR02253 family HAD-type hydrolase [Promethearchaeota archaeon]
MIRLIALDLDDTLYNSSALALKSRLGGLKKMQELGLKFVNFDKAAQILKEVVKEFGSNYSKHFDIFLQRIKGRPEIIENSDFSIAKYVAAGIIGYHYIKVRYLKPYKDVQKALEKFKNNGYKIIIISDGIAVKQYEKLIRMKIVNYFDNVFISDEVGIKKPNPELLKYCLAKMNIAPNETIYIGDRLDYDIKPANELGIHSVLIHRGGKYDPNIHNIPRVANPEFEIHSLTELSNIIDNINNTDIMEKNKIDQDMFESNPVK